MSFTSCFSHSPFTLKAIIPCGSVGKGVNFPFPTRSNGAELCNRGIARSSVNLCEYRSFIGGSQIIFKPEATRLLHSPKNSRIHASCETGGILLWYSIIGARCFFIDAGGDWLSITHVQSKFPTTIVVGFAGSQLASAAFTVGTVAVLPFYTLMVVAPKSELTKKSMESSIPYVVLGTLYAYLLYLSWTPETLQLIFANKYLLPELTSIAKMFSSEMTLASAWIHLLVIDLFAARHVFLDGQKNQIETRHSVSFCLFFCPIGILSHVITKAVTKTATNEGHVL